MNIRRLAVGAGLGFAFTVGALALSSAAQASDKPAAVDCPGGVVDRAARLPEQASDRAKAVVARVAPGKPQQDEQADEPAHPAPPVEVKPEPKPEPTTPAEPADEPAPVDEPVTDDRGHEPTPAPTTEPVVEVPPLEVPPVVIDTPPVVIETPPVVVDPAPTTGTTPDPEPVVITLPADDLVLLPDADAPVQTLPRIVPTPVLPALPVQLPVVIGPTATEAAHPPATTTVGEVPAAATEAVHADPCDDPRRMIRVTLIGQLIDSLTAPAEPKVKVKARPGCPTKPDAPTPATAGCAGIAGTTNSPGSSHHLYADTANALPAPALDRIEHARARCHLPASRHTAVEPGPA